MYDVASMHVDNLIFAFSILLICIKYMILSAVIFKDTRPHYTYSIYLLKYIVHFNIFSWIINSKMIWLLLVYVIVHIMNYKFLMSLSTSGNCFNHVLVFKLV